MLKKWNLSESFSFSSKSKLSFHWRKLLSTEQIKMLLCQMFATRPAKADDVYCFDRLRAMTLVTMYWLVLVELEASMHALLPELWEWGQYLCTSMLEFSLHMEWLLLMLSMRRRSRVPRYMNQVEQFLFLWIRKRNILQHSSLIMFIYSYLVSLSCPWSCCGCSFITFTSCAFEGVLLWFLHDTYHHIINFTRFSSTVSNFGFCLMSWLFI